MKNLKLTVCLLLVAACLLLCGGCAKESKVTIASKQFTENILLSEMYAQLIEDRTDIKVERKQNLGGTSVCFPAMEKGEIDIYVEYTGTAYNEILKLTDKLTSDELRAVTVDKLNTDYDITMFQPIGINNTFALALLRTRAAELGVQSMSDLAGVSGLIFGANHLYYTRENDGYDTMLELYGMTFADSLKMDTSLLYEATAQGQIDVMVVYATDSLLKKYDMTILDDDKEMFPPYHGAPICRNDTLKAYPALAEALDLLAGRIDDVRMQELDYEVDVGGRAVGDVAKDFLTAEGLLS